MQKKHIITITGKPGSGKSTTSKGVAAILGYEHFSSGDFFRAIGKERGVNVLQANISGEHGSNIDEIVDGRLREIGETKDNMVIDSRTAWHWIPSAFKVYLELDLLSAAERILASTDPLRIETEHIPSNSEEYANTLQLRMESETRRYIKFYDANPHDMQNYNLVVNTKEHAPEETIKLIIDSYNDWIKS
jgi:CMP/dCMP kinase